VVSKHITTHGRVVPETAVTMFGIKRNWEIYWFPMVMGVPLNGWRVDFMENPKEWMRTRGIPISGNLHMQKSYPEHIL